MTFWYVLHETHSEFCDIQHSVFSDLCWHIQSYSALLRHIHTYWDTIKAYSGLLKHIQYPVQPSHIHNLAIFWSLAYLEPEAYLKPCETDKAYSEPCHRTLFSHFRTLWNPCIWRNLAYSESWKIQKSSIIASQHILITLSYLRKFTNIQKSDIFKTHHKFGALLKI